jgi:hypothetical protein
VEKENTNDQFLFHRQRSRQGQLRKNGTGERTHSLVGLGEQRLGGLDEVKELVDVHLEEHTCDLSGERVVDGGDERVERLSEGLLLLGGGGRGEGGGGEALGGSRSGNVGSRRDSGGGAGNDGSSSVGHDLTVGRAGDSRSDGVGSVAGRKGSGRGRGHTAEEGEGERRGISLQIGKSTSSKAENGSEGRRERTGKEREGSQPAQERTWAGPCRVDRTWVRVLAAGGKLREEACRRGSSHPWGSSG